MSVVGFDIGNDNCVIAVAKQRGVDVLLNDESQRENPTVISFGEKQRFIGSAGAASATMHPKSTVYQIKRLIGRNFKEPSVQNDLKLLPFETSEGLDGGILIHLQYLNEKQTFTPVQILAMLLAHLKQITEKNLEMNVGDCVVGIPSYFTAVQRRAYLQAAEIAGLKPLRLMHDCTAIGLGYGIYKTEFPSKGPANVAFVDIGHSDMQVAVISFEPGRMKVLAHAFDMNLGGRDFDEALFRHFAGKFKEQYKIDVYSNARASLRLRASCEKLKKVLSANAEAPLSVECLMEEKDVKGFIKREEFVVLSRMLLERITKPCHRALQESGLNAESIHSVELVGSGSRIPMIATIVKSIFGKDPRRSLNASECVARGCALQCAMVSPIFRVKEYEVQDCFPFSIGFALDKVPVCTLSEEVLFHKGKLFPSTTILTVQRNDIFQMEAFYANPNELPPGVPTRISSIKIGPFRISHVENTKIKVKVHLNLHGIVTIESASLIDDGATANDSTDNHSGTNESSSQESPGKANGPFGHGMRRLKAIRRQDIFIDEYEYGRLTPSEVSQAQETEVQLTQQDIKMEQTKEKKNALESYVYDTRNKLLDSYRSFATESEKEGISSNLQKTENWLYEDGDDESMHVYTKRLEDLKKMVDPVENRYKDEEPRAHATRNLINCIMEYRKAAGSLPPRERDAVIEECNETEHWLREKSQQQDTLPKNADPVLWSSDIKEKADALAETCKHLRSSKFPSSNPNGESEARDKRDEMELD